MNPQGKGCIPLFRIAGITVLMHWSWLVVAAIELSARKSVYQSPGWNVAEYLSLFGIVLLHEMGHAFACRSVGGKADVIVLWPLGGIAYVSPPPRPGALLWSIAAGPLVNVILIPVTMGLWVLSRLAPPALLLDISHFTGAILTMNLGLLIFNVLPIFPLDGGQMLHAVLWFVMGRARSLLLCSIIGLAGAGGLVVLALFQLSHGGSWLLILAAFIGFQALNGFRNARTLAWLQPAMDHLQNGVAAMRRGDWAETLAQCDQALALLPDGHPARAEVHSLRAMALLRIGSHAEALAQLDEAIHLNPEQPVYHVNRGLAHARQGHYAQAIEDYQQALHLAPNLPSALNNLAWVLATALDPIYRNGPKAVELAQRACSLSGGKEPCHLGTLAAACAEVGDYDSALRWQKQALASPSYCKQHGEKAWKRIQEYEAGQPHREELGSTA